MSSDEEITDLLETPDSEEEIRVIMTEILQPRTHPTERFGAFPDLETALEFVFRELETADQARTNEPPTQTNELSGMTDSIVITTERVPPQMGSIVPYELPAVSEFDVNQTVGAELHPLLGIVCQIAVPECQNQPAFPTHQPGECSDEPAESHDNVSAFLVDNYPVTPEHLDGFHAVEGYLWEFMAIPDFEISHPTSELHDLTESSLADGPSHEAPINAEPNAGEEAIYLPHQSSATFQLEANAPEFSNLIDSPKASAHLHTNNGAEGPYHRAVPECQNLSASPIHQHDESNTQPALESPDIAMNFTDSNPVNQQDLQALQEALCIVSQPSSPSFFNIPVPGPPEIAIHFPDSNPSSPSFFGVNAPGSHNIAINLPDSNPVNQQDLQALQEARGIVSQPSSPSSFDIYAPAPPDLTESPMAHSPISRSLTDVEENAFKESLDPPHQPTATSESQPSNI